jgi:hypothetical protein
VAVVVELFAQLGGAGGNVVTVRGVGIWSAK